MPNSLSNNRHWDRLIINAVTNGDEQSYILLLGEIQAWLMRYFQRRMQPHVVDDLVQDTLMAIHNKRATYNPKYPCGAWVATIARHKMIDYVRVHASKNHVSVDDVILQDTNNPVHDFEVKQYLDSILQGSAITDQQLDLIEQVKIQNHSVKDVAQKMGKSPSWVKVNVHRTMTKLKQFAQFKNK